LSSGLWAGLVVANQGKHFSAGVDLKLFIESIRAKDWPAVDRLLKRFQDLYQALGRADRPVVVAAHGYALGAGCEIVLAANRVLLGVETFLGLPEAKVGLIPGAGGCKEMLVRYVEMVPAEPSSHAYPAVRQAWETIRSGKISGSGPEALEIGLLRPEEVRIVPNPDLLVGEAKRRILSERVSHARSTRIHLPALGEAGQEALRAIIAHERGTGLLTEASAIVAEKLAWVLCGGNAKAGEWIDEQRVLDLEREAFLSLCGLPGTLARLEQFLATGK